MNIYNWAEKAERPYPVEFVHENRLRCNGVRLERVFLPKDEEGVQVACGQYFSVCLTSNGRIVFWGSISGKINEDGHHHHSKPE